MSSKVISFGSFSYLSERFSGSATCCPLIYLCFSSGFIEITESLKILVISDQRCNRRSELCVMSIFGLVWNTKLEKLFLCVLPITVIHLIIFIAALF